MLSRCLRAKGKLARNKLPIIGISISLMIQRTCLRGKLLELIFNKLAMKRGCGISRKSYYSLLMLPDGRSGRISFSTKVYPASRKRS